MTSSLRLVRLALRLIKGLEAQAQAIDRLAASNEELVDVLMQEKDQAGDPDEPIELDLAGKPLRDN